MLWGLGLSLCPHRGKLGAPVGLRHHEPAYGYPESLDQIKCFGKFEKKGKRTQFLPHKAMCFNLFFPLYPL